MPSIRFPLSEPSAHTPYKDFLALASDVSNGNVFAFDESRLSAQQEGTAAGRPESRLVDRTLRGFNAGDNFGSSNLNVVASPLAASGDLGRRNGRLRRRDKRTGQFRRIHWRRSGRLQLAVGRRAIGPQKVCCRYRSRYSRHGWRRKHLASLERRPEHAGPRNNISGSVATSYSLDYLGTVRARVGYLLTPALLAYGSGGLAYGQANLITQTSLFAAAPSGALAGFAAGSANYSNLLVGWTAGGGMEWMFHPNWSVKAEYLYYDLGAVSTSGPVAGTTPRERPSPPSLLRARPAPASTGTSCAGA